MATLTYAYSESTAVVGPLAPVAEPHSWDLCESHASRITAPLGWEMLRVDHIDIDDDDEDITALAEAVREAGRVTTGLVEPGEDPIEYAGQHDYTDPDTSRHPVYRTKRMEQYKQARRSHLRVVPDLDNDPNSEPSDVTGPTAPTEYADGTSHTTSHGEGEQPSQ